MSTDLLAKVDAILEKSRKLAADNNEPNWHRSVNDRPESYTYPSHAYVEPKSHFEPRNSNKSKIFAAMADREKLLAYPKQNIAETPTLMTPNTMVADLASLAARYNSELEKSSNQSYRNKVDLETLEGIRNDLRMKTEILDRKVNNEGQRLIEKETSLSKVDYI